MLLTRAHSIPGRLVTLTYRNMSVQQPAWSTPQKSRPEPVLKVYNSLTRSKNEFVARDGRRVKWYNCGPTVYDASHMGHARNYVSQDILRRIMSDYFGYDVHFVMNITDIDDKIIKRARQNHLLEQFRAETTAITPDLVAQIHDAWRIHIRKQLGKGLPAGLAPAEGEEDAFWPRLLELAGDPAWKQECTKRDEKFDMHLSAASQTLAALEIARGQLNAGTNSEAAHKLISESSDILSQALDDKYKSTVTDPAISRKLAAYWEGKFFEDMKRLRVRDPDTVTRVTEYVPEIVSFVEGIVKNGYGYESEGSVYFDTDAFDNSPNHDYAKLEPWNKGNRELLQDGEGALSNRTGSRRPSDFALWKASKPGEPSWPSPWGAGRPGWHIECSVMASAVLGDNMDIHSGGVDLAFPHHDNEMAQSEAFHECGRWVNYFLHTGHLHIQGLKMSKSLKNFITIDEILQKYSARQLRLAFLTQLWNTTVDFTPSVMTGEVRGLETTINNFFINIGALVSQARASGSAADGQHHYEAAEGDLRTALYDSQYAFRVALCDSFNTPAALNVLKDLISRTNVYITARGKTANVQLLENVGGWIGNMLRMFGLGSGSENELGWGADDASKANGFNRDEVLMPYVRALSTFRDSVRQLAIAKGDTALKDILALCDRLRDVDLVPLGVALDDGDDGQALVKLVPPAELIRARDEKRAQAEAKAAKKTEALAAERAKRAARLEKGRVAPQDMFKPPNVVEGTYGSWNDEGVPLTDGEGKELSKNQAKKVLKDRQAQEKLHSEWLAAHSTTTQYCEIFDNQVYMDNDDTTTPLVETSPSTPPAATPTPTPRKRGRPPGSKNKATIALEQAGIVRPTKPKPPRNPDAPKRPVGRPRKTVDPWQQLAMSSPEDLLTSVLNQLDVPNRTSTLEDAFKSHLGSLAIPVQQPPPGNAPTNLPSLYSILKTFWLPTSPSYFALTASSSTGSPRVPSVHRFLYWDPLPLLFNGLHCATCSAPLQHRGVISSGPLSILDLSDGFMIIGCVYACPHNHVWSSVDSSVRASLPDLLAAEFPARLIAGDVGINPDVWNWQARGVSRALWNLVLGGLQANLSKEVIIRLIRAVEHGVPTPTAPAPAASVSAPPAVTMLKKEEEEELEEEDAVGEAASPIATHSASPAPSQPYQPAAWVPNPTAAGPLPPPPPPGMMYHPHVSYYPPAVAYDSNTPNDNNKRPYPFPHEDGGRPHPPPYPITANFTPTSGQMTMSISTPASVAAGSSAIKPRSPRHCVKCGSQTCKGKGGRSFCTNPCMDCGKTDCRGRNSRKPDQRCEHVMNGTNGAANANGAGNADADDDNAEMHIDPSLR
ncbi:DALR-2 domain-containing protein [Mycena kentingensis (nom. inval.)]|nr:DALR-2 domain-containing protein [Mycena kentingensis (nom. inval.)]